MILAYFEQAVFVAIVRHRGWLPGKDSRNHYLPSEKYISVMALKPHESRSPCSNYEDSILTVIIDRPKISKFKSI